MPESEKKRFHDISAKDNERCRREMEAWQKNHPDKHDSLNQFSSPPCGSPSVASEAFTIESMDVQSQRKLSLGIFAVSITTAYNDQCTRTNWMYIQSIIEWFFHGKGDWTRAFLASTFSVHRRYLLLSNKWTSQLSPAANQPLLLAVELLFTSSTIRCHFNLLLMLRASLGDFLSRGVGSPPGVMFPGLITPMARTTSSSCSPHCPRHANHFTQAEWSAANV